VFKRLNTLKIGLFGKFFTDGNEEKYQKWGFEEMFINGKD